MPGIDPNVITHCLNVCPSSKPVQQKKMVFALERDNAITDEVQKLVGQCSNGQKGKQQVEDVCRFY